MPKWAGPAALWLVVALAALSAAPPAPPDDDRLPLLPRGQVRAPDPAFLELTGRIDPLADAWDSEVFSEAAQRQLDLLAGLLASGQAVGPPAARAVAAPDYSGGPLRPSRLREVFRHDALSVLRADIPSGGAAARGQGAAAYRGAAGLTRALGELSAPLKGASGIRAEFQILSVEAKPDRATAVVWFHAGGRAPSGTVEQTAVWRTRWARPASGPPLLQGAEAQEHEEVAGRGLTAAFFSDATQAVLGRNRSFQEQLRYGADHWLERIESWIETDAFGHHGIALGDVNGDGLEDLYVCQMAGLPNLLFVQNPDGTATDVSAEAGVDWLERTRSALLLDLDNDGDQDLVVATSAALLFMENDGKGRFGARASLVSSEGKVSIGGTAGSVRTGGSPGAGMEGGHYQRAGDFGAIRTSDLVSMAAADYDHDGNLDIYACAYHAAGEEADKFPIPVPYHDANNGGSNLLIRNEGGWRFSNVTKETGLDVNNSRFSFAASWEDYDNDGDQDLYVANDFGRNNLYRNDGGRFVDVAASAGVEDIAAGMSVSWADYDHDGWMDLYVGNMFTAAGGRIAAQPGFLKAASPAIRSLYQHHAMGNSLYRNAGDGSFRDVSAEAGVAMGRWAWSSNFIDFNNDGWEDLLVANGYFTKEDPRDLAGFFWREVIGRSPTEAVPPASAPSYARAWRGLGRMIREGRSLSGRERNCAYLNTRGSRFANVSATSGLDFIDDARAAAATDWDHDGDLDVWLVNRTGPRIRLARNDAGGAGRFLQVKLEGRRCNRDAVGARLELRLAGAPGRAMIRTLHAGDGYLAQSSKWVHFGLGEATSIDKLVVRWPGGPAEEILGLEPDRRYRIVQGEGRAEAAGGRRGGVSLAASELHAPSPFEKARIFLSAPVPAPTVQYRGFDGTEQSLEGEAPGPVLVTLWSSGCGACERDLGELVRRREELDARGLRVVALNVDALLQEGRPEPSAAQAALDRIGFPFASGLAERALIDKLELIQDKVIYRPRPFPVPSSILIDGDGLLAALYKGPLPLDQLLADLPALRASGEKRLSMAIPFAGRRQTRSWPDFFQYMDAIAETYAEAGFAEEAVAYYRKLLRIKPSSIQAHFGLAASLTRAGALEEAIERYRTALQIDPNHVASLSNLGYALAGQGKVDEAIDLYRRALAIEPDNVATLTNLGAALAATGAMEEAIAAYRRALGVDPDNLPALSNLGVALVGQGNIEEAIGLYRRVLEQDPSSAPARINLGLALLRQGRTQEAAGELAEAVRARPEQPESRYHLGAILMRQGKLAEAASHLAEAARLRPGYVQAHYYLALSQARMGRPDEAVRSFALAMRQEPGAPVVAERLAWVLATSQEPALRDGPQAVRLAEAACEATRFEQVTALDALAASYAEAGRFREAVDTARKAINLASSRGDQQSAGQIQGRLQLYESGRPYHEGQGGGQ